jgi:prepilin-type N-terminal cleavage/methylation domain-containing protein
MKLPIVDCRLPITGQTARPEMAKIRHSSFVIRHFKCAFTLVEIMVAVVVFSMVVAAIYATFALILRASAVGQNAAAQAQRQRVVLRTIGDALMGIESFQASQKYYWFKLQNGNEPMLTFVSHLPDTFPRNGKFIGAANGHDASTRRVLFSVVSGSDGGKNLVLQQKPLLTDMDDDEQKYPLVLAKNVKEFTVEWWGTNEMNRVDWFKEWDDTQTNSIPQMLRVHLVFGGTTANGEGAADFTATRIYTVPSQMMPAMVQQGVPRGLPGGGPGGGFPGFPGGNSGGGPVPPRQ